MRTLASLNPSNSCITNPIGTKSEGELSLFQREAEKIIITNLNPTFGSLNCFLITEEETGGILNPWGGMVPCSYTEPNMECPEMSMPLCKEI